MFAGHLAAGLAIKNVERRISLGWLFFASLFHDFLLGILVLAGLEQVHVPADYARLHYLTFTFPFSHGLTATIFWSLSGFALAYVFLRAWPARDRRLAALAIGLAVFSHFVLDWIVHIPELPLLGDNSTKIGLGLWNDLPAALALETILVVIALVAYFLIIKPDTKRARYGVGILVILTAVMTVVGMSSAQTPPPAAGAAISWILETLLICGLAFWLDHDAA